MSDANDVARVAIIEWAAGAGLPVPASDVYWLIAQLRALEPWRRKEINAAYVAYRRAHPEETLDD